MSVREAFAAAGFDLHPNYECLVCIPLDGTNSWLYQDHHSPPKTWVFDIRQWTLIPDCDSRTKMCYQAVDLSFLPVTKVIYQQLPLIVQDAIQEPAAGGKE